jgi:FKBP-type peptidyl-prolyl cis-trans isomerase SlyD
LDDEPPPVEEEDDDEDPLIYTVTDLAEDKVVLDGNHPLAGLALKFWLVVADVRDATEEELEDGHPQGAFGLDVDDGLDMDIDEEPPAPPVDQRPTLH